MPKPATPLNEDAALNEMLNLSQGDGGYDHWRHPDSIRPAGVDKNAAFKAIAEQQAAAGHIAQAIQGNQFDAAKEMLLKLRESTEASLKALGVKA